MGIASRIFNILVLLAAIAAAVFAYMLWEKREQITRSRIDTGKAIEQVALTLDPDSTIQAKDMAIEKTPDQVNKVLTQLSDISRKIVNQRNDIAAGLIAFEKNVLKDDSQGAADAVVAFGTTADSIADIDKRVKARIAYHDMRKDIIIDALENFIKVYDLEAELDKETIDNFNAGNDTLRTELAKIKDKSSTTLNQRNEFAGNAVEIASVLNLDEPDFEVDVTSSNTKLLDGVKTYAQTHQNLVETHKTTIGRLADANEEVAAKLAEIDKLNKEVTKGEHQIAELKNQIRIITGTSEFGAINDMNRFDFALLNQVQGKVIHVDPNLGFIVVGTGESIPVKAMLDGKEEIKNINIPGNAIMTVATSLDPENAAYVCKAQAFKVVNNMTFANIIPNSTTSTLPKVGDVIFFSQPDIKQMIANDQKTRKTVQNTAQATATGTTEAAEPAEVETTVTVEPVDVEEEFDLDFGE